MRTFFSVFLAFFLLFGAYSSANAQIIFTNKDNNSVITLEPNAKQEIIFKLRQNGGTAYSWKVTKNNEQICKIVKDETKDETPVQGGMVGTPIVRNFYFKSTGKAGTSHIKIALTSGSGEVAEEFNFTIKTKAAPKPKAQTK